MIAPSSPPFPWRALALALAMGGVAMPAEAASAKNWTLEYEPSIQATSNLEQRSDGRSDLIMRNSVSFSYFPAADADNSALFRVQALNSRFRTNPEYDSTFFVATGVGSRRIVDSIFAYGGYQFLYKQGDSPGSSNRNDNDVFGGTVNYKQVGASGLFFHGYQFDFLRAAVEETGYQGHSLYATYRDTTTDRWTNTFGVRSQLRMYDRIGEMEFRNQLTGETSFRLYDWWSLVGEAIYINASASQPSFTFNAWNIGLFSRFAI